MCDDFYAVLQALVRSCDPFMGSLRFCVLLLTQAISPPDALIKAPHVLRRGLEQAMDQMEAERAAKLGAAGGVAAPDAAPSPRDTRKVMMRGRKAAAWRHLTLPERDALTVLTAICKARGAFVPMRQWSRTFLSLSGRASAWCRVTLLQRRRADRAHCHLPGMRGTEHFNIQADLATLGAVGGSRDGLASEGFCTCCNRCLEALAGPRHSELTQRA